MKLAAGRRPSTLAGAAEKNPAPVTRNRFRWRTIARVAQGPAGPAMTASDGPEIPPCAIDASARERSRRKTAGATSETLLASAAPPDFPPP